MLSSFFWKKGDTLVLNTSRIYVYSFKNLFCKLINTSRILQVEYVKLIKVKLLTSHELDIKLFKTKQKISKMKIKQYCFVKSRHK